MYIYLSLDLWQRCSRKTCCVNELIIYVSTSHAAFVLLPIIKLWGSPVHRFCLIIIFVFHTSLIQNQMPSSHTTRLVFAKNKCFYPPIKNKAITLYFLKINLQTQDEHITGQNFIKEFFKVFDEITWQISHHSCKLCLGYSKA